MDAVNPTTYVDMDHAVTAKQTVYERITAATILQSIERAQRTLLSWQHEDGYWNGELEGDTILESEYVLLLQFLGRADHERLRRLTNYIRRWQQEDGSIPIYPGGPGEVSASVKAYFAFKLAGHRPDEPFMVKLREAILKMGGVTSCNTFTKLYLSIFGQYDWAGVPAIPTELILLPRWFYINIYAMSSWSRAILIPLAVINSARPYRPVPSEAGIDELFVGGREHALLKLQPSPNLFSWRNFFLWLDGLLKIYHRFRRNPIRRIALERCRKWLLDHQYKSGGLGAIFPAMTHAVMAYKCLGLPDDHPAVQHELNELAKFEIEEGDTIRLVPCISPVWDTAIAVNALIDSGLPPDHPAVQRAGKWLISKEVRTRGDWAQTVTGVEPGGWYFEFENELYPDVDDTFMVMMALYKLHCAGDGDWREAPESIRPVLQRALNWTMAMQNRDGGWASFDRNNDRMILQEIPFADHNAMLDPSSADISARGLEMLSYYGGRLDNRPVQRAIRYLQREQCADGSWFGRWGVNYIYGTWQALRGLNRVGFDMDHPMVQRATDWLRSVQNPDGGWGEYCRSYEDERHKAVGPSTASQTAWAVMGLLNSPVRDCPEVELGINYLVRHQNSDGTWDEPWFTGAGFPKVFYLRYHLYRHTFPLWALGQYAEYRKNQRDRVS
ncbi:MAG: squalene--hopene cyclase [Armatimonadetes bacterium]|nr:squalene--hopene cyclase [Armatimonadota bacterium]